MAKVFLLTALLLFGLSLVVYGLLAWLMPQTYSHKLNASLDEQTVSFLAGLEEVAFSDSGGLFDQFARNREIYSMELYDDNGVLIPLPSAQAPAAYGEAAYGETSLAGYGEGNVALSAEEETGEDAPVLAGHYYFSFGDSQERYLLLVYGKAGQIAELQQAFLRLFPFQRVRFRLQPFQSHIFQIGSVIQKGTGFKIKRVCDYFILISGRFYPRIYISIFHGKILRRRHLAGKPRQICLFKGVMA